VVAAEVVAAAIPPPLRIRKPLHRVPLQCRIPVAARIQAGGVLILLARGLVAARILAGVVLILLARGPVAARIQAQRLQPAAARMLVLQVARPVMVRVMRLRRSARRMRHKVISERNAPAL
jgi:hypothetical protein